MSTELEQLERVFLKQDQINLNRNPNFNIKNKNGKQRYYKYIGLGFETPKEAIEGTYIDKKCPFTSNVSIRGRILKGVVRSTKMRRTVILRRDYLHYLPKYKRYEKRHKTVAAHITPAFRVNEGTGVTIGECRPLSKTISFNVIKVDRPTGDYSLKKYSAF
uniref:Small ribosomal subunit protein uS17 n=1 Tax=Lygus hesperus TaxID=30085 RepID=A0A0A9WAE5_LYGHE